MKKSEIVILLLIMFVLVSSTAYAYPIIITEKGINHTQAKQLVYSIPEEYYQYVKTIEFTIKPAKTKILDNYNQSINYDGWVWVYWNNKHECYNGKITLSQINKNLLIHEIGHIYELCELKKNITTEEFANNFKIWWRKK